MSKSNNDSLLLVVLNNWNIRKTKRCLISYWTKYEGMKESVRSKNFFLEKEVK